MMNPRFVTALQSFRWLDLSYWLLVTPIFTGLLTRICTLGAMSLLATWTLSSNGQLPFAVQLPLALVVADVVGYWSHRLRHRVFWRFHAIHHSPRQLDALAAARMHPVDDIVDNTAIGVVLYLCGFAPVVIFSVGPILFLHIALTHANVEWHFGALKKILVSPIHHRAHHETGANQNYAGMFAFIDLIFGTYAQPGGRPHGTLELIPNTLHGQLLWPFRSLKQRSVAPAGVHPDNETLSTDP